LKASVLEIFDDQRVDGSGLDARRADLGDGQRPAGLL
jgi:hypothetical protein